MHADAGLVRSGSASLSLRSLACPVLVMAGPSYSFSTSCLPPGQPWGVLTFTVGCACGPILRISALLRSPDAPHRASRSALICTKSTAHSLSQAECQHALATLRPDVTNEPCSSSP